MNIRRCKKINDFGLTDCKDAIARERSESILQRFINKRYTVNNPKRVIRSVKTGKRVTNIEHRKHEQTAL